MSNKSWIWKVVVGIVIAGVLVAAGFWIYQIGYRNGVMEAGAGETFPRRALESFWDEDMPQSLHGRRGFFSDEENDFIMPFHQRSDYLYNQKYFFQDRYPLFGTYFSPFSFFLKIAVFGVFLWFLYKVITMFTQGKGWQFSFTRFEDGDEKSKKK